MTSYFGTETWGSDIKFNADSINFHSESEHTIEGERYDFEMQVMHYPTEALNGIYAGMLAIIFDTKKYDESVTDTQKVIIDDFFESLRFDALGRLGAGYYLDPGVEIRFGQLINMLDTDNRWVYKGSLTVPPCTETIYWNVVRKVMPMSEKHLNWFKTMLQESGSGATGNYRATQVIDKQMPYILAPEAPSRNQEIAGVVCVALLIVFLIVSAMIYIIWEMKKEKGDGKGKKLLGKKESGMEGMEQLNVKDMDEEDKPIENQPNIDVGPGPSSLIDGAEPAGKIEE